MDGPSATQALARGTRPIPHRSSTGLHLTLNTFSTGPSTIAGSSHIDRSAHLWNSGPSDGNPSSLVPSTFQEPALSVRTSRLRTTMTLRPSSFAPPSEASPAFCGVSVESDDPLPGLRACSRVQRERIQRARSALTTRFRPDADPVPPSSRRIGRAVDSSIAIGFVLTRADRRLLAELRSAELRPAKFRPAGLRTAPTVPGTHRGRLQPSSREGAPQCAGFQAPSATSPAFDDPLSPFRQRGECALIPIPC